MLPFFVARITWRKVGISLLCPDAEEPTASFVDINEYGPPAPSRDVALDLVHLGRGCPAGLEQAQERLVGPHGDPPGDRGLAIRGQAVDAPAIAIHEVDQDAHLFSFSHFLPAPSRAFWTCEEPQAA
jgi:hypothetical protein